MDFLWSTIGRLEVDAVEETREALALCMLCLAVIVSSSEIEVVGSTRGAPPGPPPGEG